MELLDRDTFLEWMERIMTRFDHLKQTIPDIPQRPMLNGEPLLDNQEVCMMLQVSKRTLQRYRDSGTLPFHIIYHKTWYLESEITAFMEHHFTENKKRRRKRKKVVQIPSRRYDEAGFILGVRFITHIFGLTINTFSVKDGGSPSIVGCVAERLCPMLSNGLSV